MSDAPPLPDWLAPALPFRRRVVEVRGHRMHLVDHGEGRPVLLLHGNPTWSFLWHKVIAALDGQGLRLIAPDLVGLGLSDKPRDPAFHTLDRHADLLAELVDRLFLDDLVVAGQDWGGPIVAAAAARLGDRVQAALFANTAVLAPRRPLRPTAFHRFSHVPLLSDAVFRLGGFPQRSLHRVQGDPASLDRVARRAYRWPLRHLRDRAAPLALARMVPHRDDHPSLAVLDETDAWIRGFRGPLALVWGTRDPLLGKAWRRLREARPDAAFVETAAGHFLQEEVPDVLAREIRALVARADKAVGA